MKRLANALFWVSDGVAWLMIVAFVAFGIGGPLVAPIVARMRADPPPSLEFLVGLFLSCAFAALSCYLIARRRLIGLAAILAACCVLAACGFGLLAVVLAGFSLVVFGTPLVLAYLEWHQHARKAGET